MFTEGDIETAGLDRQCNWLICPVCGGRVLVGERVAIVECQQPMHLVRREPALAWARPRIGLPVPSILALGVALGFVGFLWANLWGVR